MTKPLVIYHRNCADGAGAAYAAWLAFGEDAEYRAAQYSEPAPSNAEVAGRDVYIFDFSFKRAELVRLHDAARSMLVLDHHSTAQEDLAGMTYARFDMSKSGATMAWDYFNETWEGWAYGKPASLENLVRRHQFSALVQYLQDYDLWKFELPDSRQVSMAMSAYGIHQNFRAFSQMPTLEKLAAEGKVIERYQGGLIAALARNAQEVELDGHRVLAANSAILQSELGERLAQGRPFGVVWFRSKSGQMIVSLRSGPLGVHVGKIAEKFSGGGRETTAGFAWPLNVAPWREV